MSERTIAIVRDQVRPDDGPDQQDVLAQARLVHRLLAELGHSPMEVAFGEDLAEVRATLSRLAPRAVFNLVESVGGSGRMAAMAPALYHRLGLPFTGSDDVAQTLSGDKLAMKRMLGAAKVPTPFGLDEEALRLGFSPEPGDYIVKSRFEHASLGMDETCLVRAATARDLAEAMERLAPAMGGACMAERFVDGREFSVALLAEAGHVRKLACAEMVFSGAGPNILGYASKWDESHEAYAASTRSFAMDPADHPLRDRLFDLARRCWDAFGLAGYARVDFRVDRKSRPFVIDVNPNPCLAEDAGFMAAASHAGLSPREVVRRILDDALRRTPRLKRAA